MEKLALLVSLVITVGIEEKREHDEKIRRALKTKKDLERYTQSLEDKRAAWEDYCVEKRDYQKDHVKWASRCVTCIYLKSLSYLSYPCSQCAEIMDNTHVNYYKNDYKSVK
jgi:hypothetical protein